MVEFAPKMPGGQASADWNEGINLVRMREERLAKAKVSLKKNDIAACLLMRPENIRYVTSTKPLDYIDQLRYSLAFAEYDPILYEMPPGIIFGKCPWIKSENLKMATQWANGAGGRELTWEMAKKFAQGIRQGLEEKGLEKEKLGVDKLDLPAYQALQEIGMEMVDVMPAMLEARAIKTEDEINCLKMAAAIAEAGWYAIYEALKPGVRDCDMVAVANDALFRKGAESIWSVAVNSGPPGPNTDKIVQVGDIFVGDFIRVTYMGYNTCYYRNIIVGRQPTDKEKDQHKRSYERIYKVLDAIKPGVSTAEVAKCWKTASDYGFPSEEHAWCEDLAHGIGLWLYEYPTINRAWSLNHPMILQKGMTMAVEAMEFDPEIGRTKLEEMIVVTDKGVELMTKMPVKDIMVAKPIVTA